MTSILFIAQESSNEFVKNRFIIEAMLSGCKESKVELLVLFNSPKTAENEKLDDWLTGIMEGEKFSHLVKVGVIDEMVLSEGAAYSKLLKEAKGDNICFFDGRSVVSPGWLYELNFHYSLIENAGACAIPLFSEKKAYSQLLDKNDEMISVYKTENDSLHGVVYCSSELVNKIGVDEKIEVGAVKEFSLQLAKCSYNNFYIPKQLRSVI